MPRKRYWRTDRNRREIRSKDLVAENIERLKSLFPGLVTEGPRGWSVNVDVLKALVGECTVIDTDEKYGLTWHGKRHARRIALTPSTSKHFLHVVADTAKNGAKGAKVIRGLHERESEIHATAWRAAQVVARRVRRPAAVHYGMSPCSGNAKT